MQGVRLFPVAAGLPVPRGLTGHGGGGVDGQREWGAQHFPLPGHPQTRQPFLTHAFALSGSLCLRSLP